MTTPIQEAKGIPPHAYAAHVAEVLARSRTKQARRRWVLYAVAAIVTTGAMVVLPGFIMLSICVGLPLLVAAGVLGASWRESREYDKEHDLP
jgi:hypothetical protein